MTAYRISRRRLFVSAGAGVLGLAVVNTVSACSTSSPPSRPVPTAGGSQPSAEPLPTSTALPTGWNRVNLSYVSAYLLLRGKEVAIVDTGTPGSESAIEDGLKAAGSGWSAVKHVILTHYHDDHIGGLSGIEPQVKATFYAGSVDLGNIISDKPLKPLNEGDEVFGLRIVDTPGHTRGHISIFEPGTGTLVAGDALRTQNGLESSDPQYTTDQKLATASVKKLAGLDIKAILPGHGEPLTAGAKEALQKLAASL
ncbi:MBL fold metallo-hydrolase [Actinoplanes sp. L3-i22]|uniref:MBL fold metallo-hydrolase n=1 Tax=Actinoplanes sp. L3-i22 TaxID=2836373 RepID=UPI001C762A79|nr:MBL fold metallo-hydrolase [Actinoplanes sp. L3-i22]BCY06994.1 glyoxalase [Actinoplanes sp. L3-i22]